MRRIAAAYRSGHYTIRPDLAEAPVEFKLLGDALIGTNNSIEGIADLARDTDLGARQPHREIAGLHGLQSVQELAEIELGRGCRSGPGDMPVRLAFARDALT